MIKYKKKGFTIVELVIVIAVIAILSAILIPTFTNLVSKAKLVKQNSDFKNAYEAYCIDNVENDSTLSQEEIYFAKDGILYEYKNDNYVVLVINNEIITEENALNYQYLPLDDTFNTFKAYFYQENVINNLTPSNVEVINNELNSAWQELLAQPGNQYGINNRDYIFFFKEGEEDIIYGFINYDDSDVVQLTEYGFEIFSQMDLSDYSISQLLITSNHYIIFMID